MTTFSDFINKNPDWKATYNVSQRDDDIYNRIKIKHNKDEYHACINIETGEIWIDCSKRKIFVKHLNLLFWRPIDTILRTLWHLTVIGPLANEFYKLSQEKQSLKDVAINTLNSLADIVRTPAYGIVMTIGHLAAVILGVVRPNSLYKSRDIIGKIERSYHRVENILDANSYVASKCFSPVRNLIVGKGSDRSAMTLESKEIKEKLKKFAKSQVNYLQNQRFPCNNYGLLYPKDKPYKSAIASGNHFCTF